MSCSNHSKASVDGSHCQRRMIMASYLRRLALGPQCFAHILPPTPLPRSALLLNFPPHGCARHHTRPRNRIFMPLLRRGHALEHARFSRQTKTARHVCTCSSTGRIGSLKTKRYMATDTLSYEDKALLPSPDLVRRSFDQNHRGVVQGRWIR